MSAIRVIPIDASSLISPGCQVMSELRDAVPYSVVRNSKGFFVPPCALLGKEIPPPFTGVGHFS